MKRSRSVSVALGIVLLVSVFAACGGARLPQKAGATPAASWHYVVLGDSQAWYFGRFVADQIQRDLGIQVIVQQEAVGNVTSGMMLYSLRNDERLRAEVREAEIVTFNLPPVDFTGLGACMLREGPPEVFTPQSRRDYLAELDRIISLIFTLRQGKPTMIRAVDHYAPFFSDWASEGIMTPCKAYFETLSQIVHEAAQANGIPVAEVLSAMNGPNHDLDPRAMGLLGEDGIHANTDGQKVIAAAVCKVGYEFLVP